MLRIGPAAKTVIPQDVDQDADQLNATPDNPDPDQDGDSDVQPQGKPSTRYDIDKVDQSIASYMGPEYGPFSCSRCRHFNGQNACNIVSGPIDPDGCCNLFTPPDDQPEDQIGPEDSEAPIGQDQSAEGQGEEDQGGY